MSTANPAPLQQAIDAAAQSGGGTVRVPAGIHELRDALHLRSNVTILGEPGAILKPIPRRYSPLIHVVGFGMYEFQVRDPELFNVGMGVLIMDDNAHGFYMTAATVIGRNGDIFYTDRPMAHDYHPGKGGCVVSVFPLMSGLGVCDAAVRNLVLTGQGDRDDRSVNGCRGGGVFLQRSRRVLLEDLDISLYNGEGISFQHCADITVRKCHLHDNFGNGLHPGAGSVRYHFQDNRITGNRANGIFYCLRTTHSICEGNEIFGNVGDGISIGERDTDHILRNNEIRDNGGAGIAFREPVIQSGDRVRIENNRLSRNGGAGAEVVIAPGLREISLCQNQIDPREGNSALQVGAPCHAILFAGNTIRQKPQARTDVTGDVSAVTWEGAQGILPSDGFSPPSNTRHLFPTDS